VSSVWSGSFVGHCAGGVFWERRGFLGLVEGGRGFWPVVGVGWGWGVEGWLLSPGVVFSPLVSRVEGVSLGGLGGCLLVLCVCLGGGGFFVVVLVLVGFF